MLKRFAVWITILSVIAALLSCAMATSIWFYTYHKLSEFDELKELVQDLKEDIHDKEMSCEVLKATITNGTYSHDYCK